MVLINLLILVFLKLIENVLVLVCGRCNVVISNSIMMVKDKICWFNMWGYW